jgi:hypothetical protein
MRRVLEGAGSGPKSPRGGGTTGSNALQPGPLWSRSLPSSKIKVWRKVGEGQSVPGAAQEARFLLPFCLRVLLCWGLLSPEAQLLMGARGRGGQGVIRSVSHGLFGLVPGRYALGLCDERCGRGQMEAERERGGPKRARERGTRQRSTRRRRRPSHPLFKVPHQESFIKLPHLHTEKTKYSLESSSLDPR